MKAIDITGQRFGSLVAIKRADIPSKHKRWECVCDCGKVTYPLQGDLRIGKTRSCGCKIAEAVSTRFRKHGGSNSRLYHTWGNMIARCENKAHHKYKWYGGRGITVCEAWRSDYATFREWALANGYEDNLTIDRKNRDKGYCPENCQWITNEENSRKAANERWERERQCARAL